jgi:hypothetical protein
VRALVAATPTEAVASLGVDVAPVRANLATGSAASVLGHTDDYWFEASASSVMAGGAAPGRRHNDVPHRDFEREPRAVPAIC